MKSIILRFMGLILVSVLIVSCSKNEQKIRIGVVAPLTGDGATYGASMKRGFDLAFDNSKGFDLIYENSKLNPTDGVNALIKLIIQDKVKVVLGAAASGVTIAMVPVADKNQVIVFSSISSSDALTGMSKYFFRNVPTNKSQGITAAKFLFNRLMKKRVAIIKKNDAYGINLSTSFKGEFKQLGGKIIYEDGYNPGTSDFRSLILKLKQINPDAVYLPGNYQEVAQFLKQAKEMNLKSIFMGGDGSYSPELIKIAGDAANGSYYTQFAINQNNYFNNFKKKFVKKYNRQPDIYDSYSYEAANIILQAIDSAGYNSLSIRNYLLNHSFTSLTGQLKFINDGNVDREYGVLTVKDGKFVGVN